MAKNRGYRHEVLVLDEAIPEEIKEEVVEVIEEAAPEVVEEPVEKPVRIVIGKLVDCYRLNIRKEPNADSEVVKVIKNSDVVEVNVNATTPDGWYKTTDGYCMSKFIKLIK